jgi:NAD(P)H-dependent nitrite reductase small subunit
MSGRWVDVGRPDALAFTPGAEVRIEDRWLAIFRLGSDYVAIDNACPHAGAPLCDGTVLDGKVVCYLHLWEFDLRTGACEQGADWSVQSYPVRLQDGVLQVQLP